MRWTWKSPNGVTKTETDHILIRRPYIVTDVTVINQVNLSESITDMIQQSANRVAMAINKPLKSRYS